MYQSIYFVVLTSIICSGNSASVPFITKCKFEDSKCIKESTQAAIPVFAAGLPEFGVDTLDPIFFKRLDASSPALAFHLDDITLTGLKDCVAKKVEFSPESKLTVKLLCNVRAVGQYFIKGELLVLPIEGQGDARIKLSKVVISAEVDLAESEGKDGKKYWQVKDWSHSYNLKDKATIEFDNLFNGNEVLGRAARELINSSSNEIVTELGPPIIKAVATKILNTIINFFKNVPKEDLVI